MAFRRFLNCAQVRTKSEGVCHYNKHLGMIMQEQKVEKYESWQTELHDFNFADFAQHAGGLGIKVTEPPSWK